MKSREPKLFNVCVYHGRERVAKETLEAIDGRQAVGIVKAVLRGNGFRSLKGLTFETILLD